jgi:hypothetical protein
MLQNKFFAGILKVNDENSRTWIQDPDPLVRGMDPDPPQNVMDPQYCLAVPHLVYRCSLTTPGLIG